MVLPNESLTIDTTGRSEPAKAKQEGANRISDNRAEHKERNQESRRATECGS